MAASAGESGDELKQGEQRADACKNDSGLNPQGPVEIGSQFGSQLGKDRAEFVARNKTVAGIAHRGRDGFGQLPPRPGAFEFASGTQRIEFRCVHGGQPSTAWAAREAQKHGQSAGFDPDAGAVERA